MSVLPVIVLGIAVVLGVMFLFWWFSADQQARRAMKALPVRPIGEAVDGEKVRIVGRATVDKPLTAPLSGRACAVWRVVVEEKVRSGKSSYWRTVVDEHDSVDFRILDAGSKAIVETSFIKPILDHDMDARSGFLNDAGPELQAFLAERGHTTEGWMFNKTMRYREGVLEPGESVCVVGLARWEADPEERAVAEGYRTAMQPKRLIVASPDDGPLLLSDEAGLQG